MIRLNALGTLDIDGLSRSSADAILSQPKRLTLLVYLLLGAGPGYVSRATLQTLFWPDADTEHAQASLRQALRFLRQHLGSDVIVARGRDGVAVDRERVRLDARDFEDLLVEGTRQQALTLYHGDLLPGISLSGVDVDLHHWLDTERERLRRLAVGTLWSLVEEHEQAGHLASAASWCRRLIALLPFDEDAVARLVDLLLRTGGSVEAITVYDQFARYLEGAFGEAPPQELTERIEAVRSQPRGSPIADPLQERVPAVESSSAIESIAVRQPVAGRPPGRRMAEGRRIAPVAFLALLITLLLGTLLPARQAVSEAVAPLAGSGQVAIVPFRADGAESAVRYLSEGMVDLLSDRISSTGLFTPVDSRVVNQRWNESVHRHSAISTRERALEVGRQLGAGYVIAGTVVGEREQVVLSATVFTVPEGVAIATAETTARVDSVAAAADRLATQLVLEHLGESRSVAFRLVRVPFAAIREYVAGMLAYRQQKYPAALERFRRALALDSTFVQAALGGLAAAYWTGERQDGVEMAQAAYRGVSYLTPSEQSLLLAYAGPFNPSVQPISTSIEAWRNAVRLNPGHAGAWYQLGSVMSHWGQALAGTASHAAAEDAFRTALVLDSLFLAPLSHLVKLRAERCDTAEARMLLSHFLRHDSTSTESIFLRWYVQNTVGNAPGLRAVRVGEISDPSALARILGTTELEGKHLAQGEEAIRELRKAVGTSAFRPVDLAVLYNAALNRGRPSELDWIRAQEQVLRPNSTTALGMAVTAALYSSADTLEAERSATVLRRLGEEALASGKPLSSGSVSALCIALQWDLLHGRTEGAERVIGSLSRASLRGASPTEGQRPEPVCARYLDALYLKATDRPLAAIRILENLSNSLEPLEIGYWTERQLPSLVLADLHHSQGRTDLALATIRRRPHHYRSGTFALSEFLIREARYSEELGDTIGAIRAYRHYVALRSHPDASVAPEVARARSALLRLQAAAGAQQGL